MSRYTRDEETRIRTQALVREWTRSTLLDPAQGERLEAELRVDLRRTNVFLRAGLALFTGLIVSASVLFVIVGLDLKHEVPIATVTGLAAFVCLGLAEGVITRARLYRFGVEEALAVAAVGLLALSGSVLTYSFRVLNPGEPAVAVGLLLAAGGGLGLYLRFGFVYAAIGGMACAAAVPFQLDLWPTVRHLVAAATFAAVFFIVRPKRLRDGEAYPGDDYGVLQAAAWAGLYIALNLQLTEVFYAETRYFPGGRGTDAAQGVFYWVTFVTIWVLPPLGLRLATIDKDRPLMDVSLAMALGTLLTNKAYLGWPRHEWDPILLGILLMGVALWVRRWLAGGPNGQRGGFTPVRLLSKDSEIFTLLSAASVKFQPATLAPRPDGPGFDGGRSGGGGAGGTY